MHNGLHGALYRSVWAQLLAVPAIRLRLTADDLGHSQLYRVPLGEEYDQIGIPVHHPADAYCREPVVLGRQLRGIPFRQLVPLLEELPVLDCVRELEHAGRAYEFGQQVCAGAAGAGNNTSHVGFSASAMHSVKCSWLVVVIIG